MDAQQMIVGGAIVLAVVAFIVWPLLQRKRPGGAPVVDVDRVEARIVEYRAALRRGTLCERCLFANGAGSRYCAQCGSRLPASRAAAGAAQSSSA